MTQTAVVIKLLPDGSATVEVTRKAMCSSDCDSCGGCAHPGEKITVIADNPVNAVQGDTVSLESSTGKVLKAAFMVYILPVLLMTVFYFVFPLKEIYRIAASAAGFIISFIICKMIYEKACRKNKIIFTITEVLR